MAHRARCRTTAWRRPPPASRRATAYSTPLKRAGTPSRSTICRYSASRKLEEDAHLQHENGFAAASLPGVFYSVAGLGQTVAVSDLRGESLLPVGILQQRQCAVDVPWFESPAAEYLELLAGDHVGVDHHFASVGILAQHQVLAA